MIVLLCLAVHAHTGGRSNAHWSIHDGSATVRVPAASATATSSTPVAPSAPAPDASRGLKTEFMLRLAEVQTEQSKHQREFLEAQSEQSQHQRELLQQSKEIVISR